jgi:DNA binding domain, excisionase family
VTQLLTLTEAAARMHIALVTVRRMSADGSLPVVRLTPHVVRIDERDLERFIEQKKATAA